jgi:hypothetical protein
VGTVLHVQADDDMVRRIDAVAERKGLSRSTIVRMLISGTGGWHGGLEEFERTPERAMCAYLPEGRFTVLFREYGAHCPRPDELTPPNGEGAVRRVIDTILMSMYQNFGARYMENPAVTRIRDRKRQEDLAAGHDSPVPL